MLETILKLEKQFCGDCQRWQPLTKEEHALFEYSIKECWGTCTHVEHKCSAQRLCIFSLAFVKIDDYACSTCSDMSCKENGHNKQGCVKRWKHQLARFKL